MVLNVTVSSFISFYNSTRATTPQDARSVDFVLAHADLVALVGGLVTLSGVLLVILCSILGCCFDAGRGGGESTGGGGGCCGRSKYARGATPVTPGKRSDTTRVDVSPLARWLGPPLVPIMGHGMSPCLFMSGSSL